LLVGNAAQLSGILPKKRYTPDEIVAKLRQVDVLVSQGQNIADAIRQIGEERGSRPQSYSAFRPHRRAG
jgi:hypothetical protein